MKIREIEDKLNQLAIKRKKLINQKGDIEESKKKIDQSKTFLLSLINNLPPLPLSTFHTHPNKRIKNIDIKNNIKENDNIIKLSSKKGNKGLKELLEYDTLKANFCSILPDYFNSIKEYISKEDNRELYRMLINNELILNKNLIQIIESKAQRQNFPLDIYPGSISMNSSLNLIAVSNCYDPNNHRVQLFDMKGSFIKSFSVVGTITDIVIIPAMGIRKNILSVLMPQKILNYNIAELNRLTSHIHHEKVDPFNQITLPTSQTCKFSGIAYSYDLDLIVVCDMNNYNNSFSITTGKIHFFKIFTGSLVSTIILQYQPCKIDISGTLLVVSDTKEERGRIYKLSMKERITCSFVRTFSIGIEGQNQIRKPHVAINADAKYYIVERTIDQSLLINSLTGGGFTIIFKPVNSTVTFSALSGICIDRETNVVAVCNTTADNTRSIILFRLPVFYTPPLYYSDFVERKNEKLIL